MKTNQDHQRIAAAFDRLFRTYGPLGQGSTPEEITRDRIERIKVYFDAVALYEECDVEAAIDSFLSGAAPGVSNPSFAPNAPMVGSETRRQMNLRLDREHRERLARPALPPPDVTRTPEAQARVKALMEKTVADLQAKSLDDDPIERHRRLLRRTNERFDEERGYSVGDREGHEDAA
jgi:hypothetical protein